MQLLKSSISLRHVRLSHSKIISTILLSTNVKDKDLAMPTPLSIGFDVKYHKSDAITTGPRPLCIVAGWMGAKERQLKPYLSFYHKRGIDTLSFAVGPNHVLFPLQVALPFA